MTTAANKRLQLGKAALEYHEQSPPGTLGAAKPIHILTPGATVRRIVNMSALTAADAKAWSSPAPLEREQRLG